MPARSDLKTGSQVLIQRDGGALAWPAVATLGLVKALSVFIIPLRVEAERD
jgi:hypothetical protein